MHSPVRTTGAVARAAIASLTILAATFPALAQSPTAADGVLWRPQSPIIGPHACMCRAAGTAYEIGERTCLGERIAECTVEINVMNWRVTDEPCPKT